jgi:hypothetical protein
LCLFAIPALGWSTTFPELLSDVPTTSVTLSQTGTVQERQTGTVQERQTGTVQERQTGTVQERQTQTLQKTGRRKRR